jgi:hypothetical protein
MTQPTSPTVDETTLDENVIEGQTGRLARTSTANRAINQLTRAITWIYSELASLRQSVGAASGLQTVTRRMTTSGAVTPADASRIVYADFAAPGTVSLPLSSTTAQWPTDAATLIEVDRLGSDVQVVSTLSTSPFQRLIAPRGTKIAVVGGAAHLQKVTRGSDAALPSGLWAVLDFDQVSTLAHGAAVTSIVPHSASTVTLPAILPTGAQRPTVHRNAINGRSGIALNGSGQFLPLTGAWLSLLRNRPSAAIYVTYLLTATGLSGDRTLVSFSVGGDATKARALLKQRDNGSGLITVGGRRDDADAAGVYVNAGTSIAPDVAVAGGRFVWSSSDLYGLKNGAVVNTNTSFQTDGNTSDTASAAAAIGANSAGTGEFAQLTLLHAVIGPSDTAGLAASYQAWSLARFREDWIVSGDVIE